MDQKCSARPAITTSETKVGSNIAAKANNTPTPVMEIMPSSRGTLSFGGIVAGLDARTTPHTSSPTPHNELHVGRDPVLCRVMRQQRFPIDASDARAYD